MAHQFINQIQPGLQINDVYMVTQPILRNTTRGDLYIAMYLSDRTGKLNGRMWRTTEAVYSRLPTEGFVRIRGVAELYQGALQRSFPTRWAFHTRTPAGSSATSFRASR